MSDEGEDSSPPRPRRKIKKIVLASSSSSESEDSGPATSTRKKRLRVLSDEDSESSGSSVVLANRRKRTLPKLRDSDGESDTSGWATDHSHKCKKTTTSNSIVSQTPKPASGFASDTSEGNSDKCSICLMRFTDQQVGTPQSCEHIFCLDCITEWSKNVNTCPVDRMTFDFIIVRARVGGRVLCTQPVQVMERVPSMELLVVEDPTICEICGNASSEETMLLCDSCDLGYHMECLSPPLTEIPMNQWLCPCCTEGWNSFDVVQVVELVPVNFGMSDEEGPSSSSTRRRSRIVRELTPPASRRPTTISGDGPSTSRGTARRSRTGAAPVRRRAPAARRTTRRTTRRRQTRAVIIEYELEENENNPVTKTVKRRIKKRKRKKRQPSTAARLTHVRESVRAALATLRAEQAGEIAGPARVSEPRLSLSAHRARAGIPALSLFGSTRDIDYFSEQEEDGTRGGGSATVAARPAAPSFAAYRQARRKMISNPSPTPATSATDVLSTILESQTLLHSKRSVVSISANGDVDIKLEGSTRRRPPETRRTEVPAGGPDDRVDVTQSGAETVARKMPSYPGQSRGGGGWGGGYRYPRDHAPQGYGRGGQDNGYGHQARPHGERYQNDATRRDNDGETFNAYENRRPNQYSHGDELPFERNRRGDGNRPPHDNYSRRTEDRGRYGGGGGGAPWRPYAPRLDAPPPPPAPLQRHSFGGFDNPLDMRMGTPLPRPSAAPSNAEKPPDRPCSYGALPEPPAFIFDSAPRAEGEEDERSDSSLVIDTEKYDPTEPTNDDEDSADETLASVPEAPQMPLPPPPTFPVLAPQIPPAPPPPPLTAVESILSGIDTGMISVPDGVLDDAVRHVLRGLKDAPPPPAFAEDRSDGDSDGDCPNFSIYSATSVHIASNAAGALVGSAPSPPRDHGLEDLVQGDGDASPVADLPTPSALPIAALPPPPSFPLFPSSDFDASAKRKSDEYKEKVSKRCPITTNTRNPIKIKLNTPSLIRRQVSLYDEEEVEAAMEPEVPEATEEPEAIEPPNEDESEAIAIPAETEPRDQTEVDPTIVNRADPERAEDETDSEKGTPELENVVETETTPAGDRSADLDRGESSSVPDEETSAKDDRTDKSEGECPEDEEASLPSRSPHSPRLAAQLEKMTESISETEDERSYTPCLDENRERDEPRDGIEGLDTELISEDDGDEIFSEEGRHSLHSPTPPPIASPPRPSSDTPAPPDPKPEEGKKKKKKGLKKTAKERKNKGKKGETGFKKAGKAAKERIYREREKDDEDERRDSGESERQRRKKEKRKDLERYDVRTLVTEKRRRTKDAFGRDVSPRGSRSPSPPRLSPSKSPTSRARRASSSPPRRLRGTPSPRRVTPSPSPRRSRPSPSPRRSGVSPSPRRIRASPSPRRVRMSPSPRRVRMSPSPRRVRMSPSPRRVRLSPSPRRVRLSPSPRRVRLSPSPLPSPCRSGSGRRKRRRSPSRGKRAAARRRRSGSRTRKRRRSASPGSPKPKTKKKKRARSHTPRRKSPKRKRGRRRSESRRPAPAPPQHWSPRPASPRTPPPAPAPLPPLEESRRVRKRRDRSKHRRVDGTGPSKEVFTSGDNILVSVSFKEQERGEGAGVGRRERRRERRRRRRVPLAEELCAKPVAIIDLERSPFRELTPSPKNVIVLSDDEHPSAPPAPEPAGPKTPPEPAAPAPAPPALAAPVAPADSPRGPNTPPEPPDSPDAYDPYEPTASPSPPPAASPPRVSITLEAAQKTNMSADEVLDRRPLSPIEKVMALLQSTRDVPPDPPPSGGDAPAEQAAAVGAGAGVAAPAAPAPAPRIVLPEPRAAHPPKLFLAKPSPIKSDPIKPMQATKISRLPLPMPLVTRRAAGGGGESPYSPGSSDFGDLFEPPPTGGGGAGGGGKRDGFDALFDKGPPLRKKRSNAAKVPVKLNKKKGKTQVDVKIDDDSLKVLDELPSSAVEMQVKSKVSNFLKKLNRQERVVEEVKLVLKPHYNKKRVTKEEYKHILRRTVPKICHNKTGEINPTKIQALVEAYVKKFRKKRKLGVV